MRLLGLETACMLTLDRSELRRGREDWRLFFFLSAFFLVR